MDDFDFITCEEFFVDDMYTLVYYSPREVNDEQGN